jgi:aspartokinase-like uncharacterized kinase
LKLKRLIKVGGSLLGWPGLVPALRSYIGNSSHPECLVFGGGVAADLVRDWHKAYTFSQSASHWLAIGAMDLVAHAMVEAIPGAIVWSSPLAPNSEGLHIVVPSFFCKADAVQDPNNCLPESWEATSDSIAIRMATVWRIPSLILCKSCGVQGDSLLSPVGPAGFVDPLFFKLANRQGAPGDIRAVNLLNN